ncbi:MAG: response regulator, partial [Candidatus Rokuibacteriota bacterium]
MTPQPVRPRILVVDDHPANRMAFLAVLEDSYSVYLAESGKAALELALQQEFAVILLDVRMPDLDGHQTAKLLRQRERAR